MRRVGATHLLKNTASVPTSLVLPDETSTALDRAMRAHRAGQLAEAERQYHEVLTRDPRNADAVFLAGVIAMDTGRPEEAVQMFERATALVPHNAAYHANLGEAHRRLHRFAPAFEAFLRAMSLKADLAAPVYNLGLLLHDRGASEGAIACFERAAELKPDLSGDIAARLAAARAGHEGRRQGREARADTRARPAPEDASSATALLALSTCLIVQGRSDEAIALLLKALELSPGLPAAHGALGSALSGIHRLDEAIASLRRAIQVEDSRPELHAALGNVFLKCGLLDDAIDSYRTAIRCRPDDPDLRSNLIYTLHYRPGLGARAILDEARPWNDLLARVRGARSAPHLNDRTPDRRLRIGYVSADFRQHCQAFFMAPLLAHHDHQGFEIFCYSNVVQPDEWTQRLRSNADHWRSITGVDDSTVASRIRDDRIDVLVDLTMHMEGNRLSLFARKPAPVQVCWLAYPGTTGLAAMDYRITDPHLDPPGSDTEVYSERSLRLPDTFWCYHPLTSEDRVSPLPAESTRHVTFGCLNNFCKVNAGVIELWARVLREVDGSRLILLVPPGETLRRTLDAFESLDVDRSRIEAVGYQARLPYLATYRRIDVCLDTFPYGGHTTSLDAFWMGVPVITLVGPTVVGRAGLCQAMNLGLPELVTTTGDEYVTRAVALAKDLDRLREMRACLRTRMEQSPLMDAPRFARNLEAAYRSIWRTWCEGG